MEQAPVQILSDKQREAFARLLADAKKQAHTNIEDDSDLERRIKNELAPQLAKKRGALPLVKKIRSLKHKIELLENALEKLGFDCDDDGISIRYDAPKAIEGAVNAAVEAARKERHATLRKFDRASLRVWTVDSVAEAQQIVEELL